MIYTSKMGLPRERYETADGREVDEYPAYAWPGGYPIVYVFADGESCCPKCANTESNITEDWTDTSGWALIGWYVHYEGPPAVCAHCGTAIESAYGDPDAPE